MKKISSSSLITTPRFRCFDPVNSHSPTSIPTNHSEIYGDSTPDMGRAIRSQAKIVTGDAGYVMSEGFSHTIMSLFNRFLQTYPNPLQYNPGYSVVNVRQLRRACRWGTGVSTLETPFPLTPKVVTDIHKRGGTILGTSQGGHDTVKIVESIQDRGINQEMKSHGLKVAVVGIPKTIDNDILVTDKSFGFDTAVEEAQRAINVAHVEAESFENGVGVVKLMGRYRNHPGLFEYMEKTLKDLDNGHMVIIIAEGAGQDLLMSNMDQQDASGNKLLQDLGLWISQKIKVPVHCSSSIFVVHLSYVSLYAWFIDPTYMIRAIPCIASDNVYCTLLAHSAIHGAMAGYTGFTVGPVNGRHAYIPFYGSLSCDREAKQGCHNRQNVGQGAVFNQ
ncbi:phosphofructokinase 7 [Actinidia rufa]|uniref:Phosphofructokinase 7 n=1 Tax=Actinidia rufa TaxID=165716 RepID=A0A7J0FZT3_9ERIC|nr:phosphofructokinase 7 [Actinidia rufa]